MSCCEKNMVSIDSSALSKKFANISVIANEVKQSKSQIVVFLLDTFCWSLFFGHPSAEIKQIGYGISLEAKAGIE
jgi:hypothetical protein